MPLGLIWRCKLYRDPCFAPMTMIDAVDIDFKYEKAEINTDLPFPIWKTSIVNNNPPLIDAIYIPTQKHRPPPFTKLKILRQHAKRIYLLFSSDQSGWAKEIGFDDVISFLDINTYFDIELYKKHFTSQNPSILIDPFYDVPAKRTFALDHASRNGFDIIGFLDDDIQLTPRNLLCIRKALN